MAECNLCDMAASSVSMIPLPFIVAMRDGCQDDANPRELGCLEAFALRLVAEPLLLVTGILCIIEIVVRTAIALLTKGLLCFVPPCSFKDRFKEFSEGCTVSVLMNMMTIGLTFTWIIKNIYADKLDFNTDWDAVGKPVKSFGECLGMEGL